MNYRLMFIVNAVVVAVFGALLLIMPDLTLTQFGVERYVATLYVARFLGGSMIMTAIFIWIAKEISDAKIQKNMAILLLSASVVGFILILLGVASSGAVIRHFGWVLLLIYILFSLGYGYLLSGVAIVTKSSNSSSGNQNFN